jgi:3-oxoacyl-[acyl-carrier-protein] synthase II
LERLEDARARGARIYAEILSGGRTADAHHITAPREDGAQAAKAMELAVRRAQLVPEDIDYICAHGTGTPLNDAAETRAIKLAFGDHAYSLAISSPKSITGHLMGAAGAVSVASTALAIYHQEIPPTMNLDSPDPECDLDYVPNLARKAKLRYALANGFGFGGQNGVVALGRIDE